jgi:hypothetical protein
MELPELKVGDLVFYQPSEMNRYANGEKQLGVILAVRKDIMPLFSYAEGLESFGDEYVVRWFESGYTSTLMGFNLKKVVAEEIQETTN